MEVAERLWPTRHVCTKARGQDQDTGVWAGLLHLSLPLRAVRVQSGAEVDLGHILRGLWSRRCQVGTWFHGQVQLRANLGLELGGDLVGRLCMCGSSWG